MPPLIPEHHVFKDFSYNTALQSYVPLAAILVCRPEKLDMRAASTPSEVLQCIWAAWVITTCKAQYQAQHYTWVNVPLTLKIATSLLHQSTLHV